MTSDTVTDEQLIARIAGGDQSALELLYDRYAAAVMGLAFKMTGDRATSEDIVQETFWRVWRNAGSYQASRGRPSGWLFGVARNLTIDLYRKRKARLPVNDGKIVEELDIIADPRADVIDATLATLRHHQVRSAMNDLPAAQQRVIELAYFWGLTRQEIAQATGHPLGTIHTRARLALQKLRESLLAEGFGD